MLFCESLFSQSWEECFLGHEESSPSKHHNFRVGEQLCFCLQQGQPKPAFQHVSILTLALKFYSCMHMLEVIPII
jgi:hypothetical protein